MAPSTRQRGCQDIIHWDYLTMAPTVDRKCLFSQMILITVGPLEQFIFEIIHLGIIDCLEKIYSDIKNKGEYDMEAIFIILCYICA